MESMLLFRSSHPSHPGLPSAPVRAVRFVQLLVVGRAVAAAHFILPVAAEILQLDENDIHADFDDVFPRNDDIRPVTEPPEEAAGTRHDDRVDSAVAKVELQIADLAQPFSVHDIDHVFGLEI